ncbi:syncytin-1-like [Alligator mississippiensis]|uniref:Syncytin-1-like n=1 Tax=Alligator mississippiensis TaxID=8496 RepID=A0A151NRI6_ALLMI|nr:syncytin-1-like [Alligator mississippiensis]
MSKVEAVSLAVSIAGVLGLAVDAQVQLRKVACALAKGLDATSQALATRSTEMEELRGATLQNRAAIDYLLLRHNHGCEESVKHRPSTAFVNPLDNEPQGVFSHHNLAPQTGPV